jgi:hypothetical protein
MVEGRCGDVRYIERVCGRVSTSAHAAFMWAVGGVPAGPGQVVVDGCGGARRRLERAGRGRGVRDAVMWGS